MDLSVEPVAIDKGISDPGIEGVIGNVSITDSNVVGGNVDEEEDWGAEGDGGDRGDGGECEVGGGGEGGEGGEGGGGGERLGGT